MTTIANTDLPITTAAAQRSEVKAAAAPEEFSTVLSAPSANNTADPSWLREFASRHAVSDPQAPLDKAGLPGPVREGTLRISVHGAGDSLDQPPTVKTHSIRISRPKQAGGTSLEEVVAELKNIRGIKAHITPEGRLVIESRSREVKFSLEDGNSGLLDALGQGVSPLKEAFGEFVGQTLFGQMLSSMRKTLGKPAYLHGGQAEEVFQGQLDQLLAESMSSARGGELANQMYDQQFNMMRKA